MIETRCRHAAHSERDPLDVRWSDTQDGAASVSHPANLRVTGEVDSIGALVLQRSRDAEVSSTTHDVRVGLEGVSFCDAAGLHALAAILTSDGERGFAMTLSVQPRLAWLMRLVGLPVDGLAELVVTSGVPAQLVKGSGSAACGGAE